METFSALVAFCAGISPVTTGTNSSATNGDAGDMRRHSAHYDVIVMVYSKCKCPFIPVVHSFCYNSMIHICVYMKISQSASAMRTFFQDLHI